VTEPKILLFDLETCGPNSLRSDLASILMFGYMWIGDKRARILTADQFPNWFSKHGVNDKPLLKAALKIMQDADLIVAHYGERFDRKFLQGRCAIHGLTPPPPTKLVDTWRIARTAFNFSSNRLGDLCDNLRLKHKKLIKEKPDHWPMWWVRAMAGDRSAIREMREYCLADVEALAELYMYIRKFSNTHPRLYEDREKCRLCGGTVQMRGTCFVGEHKYRRYECTRCGKWDRERKALKDVVDTDTE